MWQQYITVNYKKRDDKMANYYLMPHPPIIIPEIGRGREQEVKDTISSCEEIARKISENEIDTVVVISPHGIIFQDAISILVDPILNGDFTNFGEKNISLTFENDLVFAQILSMKAKKKEVQTALINSEYAKRIGQSSKLDHGALVPLYFLNKNHNFKVVHITYGMISNIEHYKFGMAIKEAINESKSKIAVIASGDLSHRLKKDGPYSYSESGDLFDKKITEFLIEGNTNQLLNLDCSLVKEAGECGYRSLLILAGAMDGLEYSGDLLSYEGPFGVGYGVIDFSIKGKSDYSAFDKYTSKIQHVHERKLNSENPYTSLARKSIEYYLKNDSLTPIPQDVNQELTSQRKGVFVSLKQNGELRGCIGTFLPSTLNIAEEIIKNAVSAAFDDPRFTPLRLNELWDIDISVDVLETPEPTSKSDLDPKIYGVIVAKGQKRGLLLPNLDGIDTVEEQLNIALNKAGILQTEQYKVERFKVTRYKEVPNND
jgi:AmmeMemoRadiSam system protein A